MEQRKLFLTGASGLLGRATYKKFIDSNWIVYGTAFTRCNKGLYKLDITESDLVTKAIKDFKPDFIIHCAAQRFPDLVEKDPIAAHKLNIDATSYIVTAAENLVLRIPVLYGPVNDLNESAVTTLLTPLLNSDVPAVVFHTEKRCPSHVDDIAYICWQLANARQTGSGIKGIYQWCGKEKMTKYEMVTKMAEIFGLPHDHITPNLEPNTASTQRPQDTEMSRSRLEKLGFGKSTQFADGISEVLKSYVIKYKE